MGVAAFENVAEFIAEVAAADVEAGEVAGVAGDEARTLRASEGLEGIGAGEEAGGDDVDAGEGIDVGDVDVEGLLASGDF